MHRVELEQGSPEWDAWRLEHCTASEAPAIMGCAPEYYHVQTWDDLRLVKAGMGAPPDERALEAFAHGHRKEIEARNALFPGFRFKPACFEDGAFGASLDGYRGTHWLEIKSPVSGRASKMYRAASQTVAPPRERILDHTWWQLVHQAGVLGPDMTACTLLVYLSTEEYEAVVIPAEDLRQDWPELRERWEKFLAGGAPDRDDPQWANAVLNWINYKHESDKLAALLKSARSDLIALAGSDGDSGRGVSVSVTERKGIVDWRAVAEALFDRHPEEDREQFETAHRKPAYTLTTVLEEKSA